MRGRAALAFLTAWLLFSLGWIGSVCGQTGGLDEFAVLANKAKALLDARQYQDALPLYQRLLNMCERSLGPEHPSTATMVRSLARL